MCELDGVADKVYEYLVQAHRIAKEDLVEFFVDAVIKTGAFFFGLVGKGIYE